MTARRRRGAIAALAVVALVLRLAAYALPPAPAPAELGTLLGEHALCLAAAGAVPAPAKPRPAGHDDTACAACCPSHAATAFVLPPAAATGEIARYAEAAVPPAAAFHPLRHRPSFPLGARAPPAA